jgi:hypothetical protein
MVEIVAAYAVPHTPSFIAEVAKKNGVSSFTAATSQRSKRTWTRQIRTSSFSFRMTISTGSFWTIGQPSLSASLKERAAQAIKRWRCLDTRWQSLNRWLGTKGTDHAVKAI